MSWKTFKILLVVGAAAVIALQWNQLSVQKDQIALLQDQFEMASRHRQVEIAAIPQPEKQELRASKEINQLQRENAKLAARNASLRAEVATAPPPVADENVLAKIMKDPDVLNSLLEMQAQEVKSQYAPLIKQLNLTPGQRDALYALLINNETNNAAVAMQILTGTNITDEAGATEAAEAAQKAMDGQIQALLGADGFAQYDEFKSSLEDRQMLAQMQDSFADNPLTEDQQQRLLQLMISARKNSATAGDDSSGAPTAAAAGALAQMNQSLQIQAQVNQEIYQQAAAFLSPGQLQSLAIAQSNILAQDQVGIALGQKILAPGSGAIPGASLKTNSRNVPASQ